MHVGVYVCKPGCVSVRMDVIVLMYINIKMVLASAVRGFSLKTLESSIEEPFPGLRKIWVQILLVVPWAGDLASVNFSFPSVKWEQY